MRATWARQRWVMAAALTVSVGLVSACAAKANDPATGPTGGGTGSLGGAAGFTPGLLLVSDGTAQVTVGDRTVTFPTPVTDAVWSGDGSRIAFVDGDGNIATARPDGSGVVVLTTPRPGAVRSRPAWAAGLVVYAEKVGNGPSQLRQVSANHAGLADQGRDQPAFLGEDDQATDGQASSAGLAPSGSDSLGQGRELAWQRPGAHGAEVWVADLNSRTPYQSKVADGSEPALSSDGKRLAFVRADGRIAVLDLSVDKATARQVSFDDTAATRLTWSADDTRIVFRSKSDVESVPASVASGATTNPASRVSARVGVPSSLRPSRDHTIRITGSDAVATSVAASQARYPTQQTAGSSGEQSNDAQTVLLVGTTDLPTMLAGAQMVDSGPLLFTGATLDLRTAAEIKRVLGAVVADLTDRPIVTIIGGPGAVSPAAETAIRAMGYATHRVSGTDPYAMAVAVAGKPSAADSVFVVDGNDVAAYASAISDIEYGQQTVLLTNGSTMPASVATFLNGLRSGVGVYAVGSAAQTALASSWPGRRSLSVTPYVAPTATGTTAMLLNASAARPTRVVIADRSSTSDVIAAIGLARGYGAPVLVVDGKAAIDPAWAAWLSASSTSINDVMVVDSAGAISADLERSVAQLVGGPLGSVAASNPRV